MKLGCSTLAYQFVGWPFWQILDNIASIGYEGLEIDFGKNPFNAEMRPGAKYLIKEEKKLRKYLKDFNLEMPSLCIMSGWSGDQDRIKESKETLKEVVELAGLFDIKTIVVVAGTPAPGLSEDKIWEQVLNNLKWAAEYTGKHDIKLSMEVVATWPIYNTETYLKSKEFIGENYYVNIDPSNFYQGGDDPINAVKVLKDDIISVHVKDAKQYKKADDDVPAARGYSPMGEGDIDFHKFIKAIKDIGYDGWLQTEYEGFFGGYNPDPVKGSKDAYDYIKPILDEI
jgi:L-ribulose-5-phosphate 3-epimerase